MSSYIHILLEFAQDHQVWSWIITVIVTFCESLLVVGLFVPAGPYLIGLGTLIAAGALEPISTAAAAIIGSVLGDGVSYAIGRRMGRSVLHKWPLNKHRRISARARLFFFKYGIYTVFIGRFIGPLRSLVAGVAGMLRVNLIKFYAANVLSALIWAPLWIMPGYLGTKSTEGFYELFHRSPYFIPLLAGSAALLLALVLTAWLILKKRRTARKIGINDRKQHESQTENFR